MLDHVLTVSLLPVKKSGGDQELDEDRMDDSDFGGSADDQIEDVVMQDPN